jgi:WD40 repeat protein
MADQSGTETNPMFTQLVEMAHKKQLQGDLSGALTLLKSALTLEGVPEVQMHEAQLMADGLEARLQPVAPVLEPTAEETPSPGPVKPAKPKRKWWKNCLIILLAVIGLCVVGGGILRLVVNPPSWLEKIFTAKTESPVNQLPGRIDAFSHFYQQVEDSPIITAENASQLKKVGMIGKDTVKTVEYYPDEEKLFVSGTHDAYRVDFDESYYDNVAYSYIDYLILKTATHLSKGSGDDLVAFFLGNFQERYLYIDRINDPDYGKWLRVDDDILSLSFSHDGQRLAMSIGQDIYLLNSYTQEVIEHWSMDVPVNVITFSPDSQLLAGGLADNSVRIWRTSDGELLQTMTWHTEPVVDVKFSPDGKEVLSASGDGTARLWNVSDGELLATFSSSENIYREQVVAFSHDGQLVGFSSDDTMCVWHVADQKQLWCLSDTPSTSIAFSPDSSEIAVVNLGIVRILSAKTGKGIKTFDGQMNGIVAYAINPQTGDIATVSDDGIIRIWDSEDGNVNWEHRHRNNEVSQVKFDSSGNQLLILDREGLVSVNATSGKTTDKIDSTGILSYAYNIGENKVITCDTGGDIFVYSADDLKVATSYDFNEDYYTSSCAISPDGMLFVLVGKGKGWVIGDTTNPSSSQPLLITGDSPSWFMFSPDHKYLVGGEVGGEIIQIWDSEKRSLLFTVPGEADPRKVSIHPKSNLLVSVDSEHNLINFWNLMDGSLGSSFDPGVHQYLDLSFSSDGRFIYTYYENTITVFGIPKPE